MFINGNAEALRTNPDYARFKELERKFIDGTITKEELAEVQDTDKQAMARRVDARTKEAVEQGSATLKDVYDNEELFAAYPQLRDLPVVFEQLDRETQGYFDGKKIALNKALTERQARTTLVHEIQHAIQAIEGFARGGNPEMFEDKSSTPDACGKKRRRRAVPETRHAPKNSKNARTR